MALKCVPDALIPVNGATRKHCVMLILDDWIILETTQLTKASFEDWQVLENDESDTKPFLIKVTSREFCCPAKGLKGNFKKPVDFIHFWAVVIGEAIAFELKVVNKALRTVKSMFSLY